MERDIISDQIMKIIGGNNSNFSVLEQGTNIGLQLDFKKFINKQTKKNLAIIKLSDDINELFDENTKTERKKLLLARLSFVDDVKSYRAIEKYTKLLDDELHDWAMLVFQQSRILIETSLTNDKKIFIASGMGGIDNKIRFLGIFKSNGRKKFENWQKNIIEKELLFTLPQYEIIVEEINVYETFVSFLCLVPINVSTKKMFRKVLNDCNEIGDFLSEKIFVTNMKKLSKNEISELIYKKNI